MTRIEGWISIRELRCTGHQGATAPERRRLSEYLVDVAVRGDLGPALERDELTAAFDIAALAQVTRQAVAERPRTLIERIAGDVARATFARFPQATEVRVRVEKPRPRGLRAAAEAVELTVSRERMRSLSLRGKRVARGARLKR